MKKELETEETNLATFEWDDTESMEFFGQKTETTDTELTEEEKEAIKNKVVETPEEDEDPKPKDKVKSKTKKETEDGSEAEPEEEVEFFVDDTNTETEEEDKPTEKADDFFSVLAAEMKEQGIFSSVEIPEGELTQEQFVELQETEVENRVQETFEGFFEEMDDDGKAFLKFKKQGGKTSEFLKTLKNVSDYPSGDIEEESFQTRALKYYYKNIENLDDDDIDDKLEWLEEGGKKEKYAKRYYKKIRDIEKAEKAAIIRKTEDESRSADEKAETFKATLKGKLDEIETIKDFSLAKKEKGELLNYITKPSVKVGKNKYITEFQKGLKDISNNYEGLILLAKLLKSDFDMSSLKVKTETKQVRELKNNLQRTRKEVKPTNSGSSGNKQLSDFFN